MKTAFPHLRLRASYQNKFLSIAIGAIAIQTLSAAGQVLFFDDFSGPTLNPAWQASMPNAYLADPYFGTTHLATYIGAPNYSFQSLNGSSVLRMTDTLSPLQRRGWLSANIISAPGFRYEARFNTLNQSPTTSIDAFIEIGVMDAANLARYDIVSPFGGQYSTIRKFCAGGTFDNVFSEASYPYLNNTWYRLVLQGSPGQNIRASLCADDGTELIGTTLGNTAGAFTSGFRIFLSQAMGEPVNAAPSDVAVDYVQVTLIPEPGSAVLIACALVCWALRRKGSAKAA